MPNKLLTINIRRYLANQPRRKRHARISRFIRARIAQQTNIKSENITISKELNTIIQKQYLYSMVPLKVNISIEKDKANVTPFGVAKKVEPVNADKKAKPAEKTRTAAAPAASADQKKPVAKETAAKKSTDAKQQTGQQITQ
jgi:ribosomal protein L31E